MAELVKHDGFRSRKFIVTMSVLVSASVLAYFSKITPDVAVVFSACVAAYNWANLRQSQAGSAPK